MVGLEGPCIFAPVLSQEEWGEIPVDIAKKISNFVTEKFEEFTTSKALLETNKFNAVQELAELQTTHDNVLAENESLKAKFEAASQTIIALENQVRIVTEDLAKIQTTCNKLEAEAADYRHQRNLAVDERDEHLKMIQRRDAEIERMQADITALTKQLETAINSKCEALAQADEVASMKITLEYKEKRIEQERSLLGSQIESLTEELNQRTEELLNMRRDNTSRCIQLEGKLNEKTQELAIQVEQVKSLTELNNNLSNRIEELTQNLLTQREVETKMNDSYLHEIEANTKLANAYKSMLEESQKHTEELKEALAEVQQHLKDATEKYGELETKHKESELAHDEIIIKKNECIAMLKKELEVANDLLENSNHRKLQKELEEISPTAATTSSILKSGMTFTEMYSKYVSISEKLLTTQEENARLNNYVTSIVREIEEKGPLIKKLREDYLVLLDTNEELKHANDSLLNDLQELREVNAECKRLEGITSRENERLKKDLNDLGRQVCHLLQEVEHGRTGSSSTTSPDMDLSDSVSSADIITKRLVTFNDIQDLQQKNQKLLAIVRELTEKQEEAECYGPEAVASLKLRVENLSESHNYLLQERDRQNKVMETLKNQRDMYKNLYSQAIKASGEDIPMHLERPYNLPDADSNKAHKDSDCESQSDDKLHDLEKQIEDLKKLIEQLKKEKESYHEEKSANDKILLDQLQNMRGEVKELTLVNCKLVAQTEVNDEKFRIMKNNAEILKKQITALEKQNKIYNETVLKHEQAIAYLKDETMQSQTKLSKAEVMLGNLQKENALLKDSESRLLKEREISKQKAYSQNLIHTNIELIKATLERKDSEDKLRLEARLDEAHRECSALRRRLQEEQDRFRELSDHLKVQTENAQKRMVEEKEEADKLRKELAEVRDELTARTGQMEDLTKQLKLSVLALPESNVDGRKIRLMEQQLADAQAEVESVRGQLKTTKEAADQYFSVAEATEKQMKILLEQQEAQKQEIEKQQNLIKELQEKCAELEGELSIQMDDQDIANAGLKSKSTLLQEELNVRSLDLRSAREQLENSRAECKTLIESLKAVENKYAREVMLHSADIQSLTTLKEELNKALDEVNELKQSKAKAIEALETSKQSWESQEELFQKEKLELESRFKDVDSQNSLLLDQIQALNTQFSLLQAQATQDPNQSTGDTSFNRSLTEDEVKSSEQLLKIIKYLRQEKDISVSKCDILEAEHLRLKSQVEVLNKQLEEAKAIAEAERQKSEISVVSSSKHAEVLRKVETLNAITDSNRALRSERDTLLNQVNQLRAKLEKLESEMAPLQEKNIELNLKAEAMQTENVSLRAEANRWRQRANMLIEKSNRTNPEDWKKLQNERETLSKQLTIEKANIVKLNDTVNTLKQDKLKLEEQLKSVRAQNNSQAEELSRLREDLSGVQAQVVQLTQSLQEAQEQNRKLTEENKTMTEEAASKDSTLNEMKNNLIQIKKIAKKYKIQWEEQCKEVEALQQQLESSKQTQETETQQREEQMKEEHRSQLEDRINQIEQSHKESMDQLNAQITTITEENENHKKEIEKLKQSSLEKEERFKALFKNAKDRIVTLAEHNKELKEELKNQDRPGRSADNAGEAGANGELLAKIENLLKEKDEMMAERQQEKDRLTAEIDVLTQKINQLQRQLGLGQGAKPSTSSGSVEKSTSEPPTANIKPMAGHSTNTQTQSVPIQPWRNAGETPLASIRPMSAQLRTVAVLPTSQSPSAVMVPPQQQVHTTGSSTIEALSSSPTSSHTDYVPATSSASSAMLGVRQVAVPPTQSSQDTEDDENVQVQPTPQQQAVALVLPRVEPPSSGPTQEQGTSSSSSSNTVTTTQAGLKRQREADTEACQADEQSKQQQSKRTRTQPAGTVSDSGLEVEYQVPTSSQRDHDDDNVIVVESDEEGCPDEGEGADDDPDDPDTEGYDIEGMEQDNYDEADCQEEEDEEGGNEVEVIEDSSEVPNQSERSLQDSSLQEEGAEQPQSEAISSGTDGVSGCVTISQASTSAPSLSVPMSSRATRPVAPLSSRPHQSQLLFPHGLEEGGDDGIVPSTPTLFVPRRSDGFSEAVSSPHFPSSGRFTFSDSAPPTTTGSSNEVVPEQTLEAIHTDENSTGRSVPSTPLQSSPQESVPVGEEQVQQTGQVYDMPTLTVSGAEEDSETVAADDSASDCMGPPAVAGTSSEQPSTDPVEEMLERDDEVSSEGEKPLQVEEGEEEGREAEASPSPNTRSRVMRGNSQQPRRPMRNMGNRGGFNRSGPTPIIWADQRQQHQQHQQHRSPDGMMRGRPNQSPNYNPRIPRRVRGRSPFRRF